MAAAQLTCTEHGYSPLEPVNEPPARGSASASAAAATPGKTNSPPAAVIVEPVACDSLTCTFNGTGSSDSDGSIARYRWDNGDGGRRAGETLSTWETTYRSAGMYTASLVVTDDGGATDTARVTVTVPPPANEAPVAGIGSSCAGLACSFWSTSTDDAGIASYAWDFGDSSEAASDSAAAHTYGSAGMYDVVLIVADSSGLVDTATVGLTVANLSPQAVITEPVLCDSLMCSFDGADSRDTDGSIALYSWSTLDNGQNRRRAGATLSTWPVTYSAAGTYTATLVVTDNAGGADTATAMVTVPQNEPPMAAIDSVACQGRACTFYGQGSSDPDGTIANWDWRFGDGGYYDGPGLPQVSHTYADTARSYEVTLAVTDNGGAADMARTTVWISDPPVAGFDTMCNGLMCTFTSTSTDDLGIVSYAWAFGDGATESGAADTVVAYTYETGGAHTITLVVADAGGQADTATHQLRFNTPPVASIDSVVCAGPACNFYGHGSADPDGTITHYDWRFGDGGYYEGSGLAQVSHTYAAADTVRAFPVTLTVTDNDAARDTARATVTISMPPTATFGSACEGYACRFWSKSTDDAGIAAYAWDFGDGTPEAADSAVTHTYAAGGAYGVTLRVRDTSGQTASATDTVHINAPPVAAIAWPPSCDSVVCTFDASGSSDGDGRVVWYQWDFGDGGTRGDSMAIRPTHTFPDSAAAYVVTLVVRDDDGAADTEQVTVTISMPPVAGFTWSCGNDRRCAFTSTSTHELGISSYAWDFGDGSEPVTDSVAAHTYDVSRTYEVTLVVADAGGQTDTVTHTVRVNAAPVASIDSVSCDGRVCSFYGHSSADPDGRVVHYSWDYGDGGTRAHSMLVSPAHTYQAAGMYRVTLTVTDNDGAAGNDTLTVAASEPPAAGIGADCDGSDCSFWSTSTDDLGIAAYTWNFGDGTPAASDSAVAHTYAAHGGYDVTLTVTDIGGQTATATRAVRVNAPPVAVIADPVVCDSLACTFDGTGSSDADDRITGFAWDFGDGSAEATDSVVTHTYGAPGSFEITLNVTDSVGATGTDTVSVLVPPNRPPVARISWSCGDPGPLDCAFDGTASTDDRGIETWAWEFGDEATGSGERASHTYASAGGYSVTLTVTDSLGLARGTTLALTTLPAIATFTAAPDTIARTGGSSRLTWEVQSADALHLAPGGLVVTDSTGATVTPDTTTAYTLTATSAAGSATAELTVTVMIPDAPVIHSFVADPDTVTKGDSVRLSWRVGSADSLRVKPGPGSVPADGTGAWVTPDSTTTYTLTATNAGDSTVTAQVTVTAADPPVITAFGADRPVVTDGDAATLTWETTGAETIHISTIGAVTGRTSVSVVPATNTVYTLTATNAADSSVTATYTVEVVPPPVIRSFATDRRTITAGDSATLSWNTENGSEVSINDGSGAQTITGTSFRVGPAATTTYTLTAENRAGTSTTSEVTVTVVPAPTINSFTAAPATITEGGSSRLIWAMTGATSLTIDRGVGSVTSRTSATVRPGATTTYTLTAVNAAGDSVTASVTVTVVAPPAINSFRAVPATISEGDTATLSWSVTGANTLRIAPGIENVTHSTSVAAVPDTTTTYTLTAVNAAGDSVTASVTVTVVARVQQTFLPVTGYADTPDGRNAFSANWSHDSMPLISSHAVQNGGVAYLAYVSLHVSTVAQLQVRTVTSLTGDPNAAGPDLVSAWEDRVTAIRFVSGSHTLDLPGPNHSQWHGTLNDASTGDSMEPYFVQAKPGTTIYNRISTFLRALLPGSGYQMSNPTMTMTIYWEDDP